MPLSGEFLPPPLPKMGMIVGEKLAEYDPFDLLPVGSVVFTTLGSVPPPDGTFAARVVPPPDGTFAARAVPPPDSTFAARVVPPPDARCAARAVPPPDGTFNVVTCALAGSGTGSPRYSGMALSERRLLSAAVRASVSPVTKSAYAGTALNDANGASLCTSPV